MAPVTAPRAPLAAAVALSTAAVANAAGFGTPLNDDSAPLKAGIELSVGKDPNEPLRLLTAELTAAATDDGDGAKLGTGILALPSTRVVAALSPALFTESTTAVGISSALKLSGIFALARFTPN